MASILNFTFSKVFIKENNTVIPTKLNIFQSTDEEKLTMTEIHVHEVHKYLLKIDPNKSVGPYEISPWLLKAGILKLF